MARAEQIEIAGLLSRYEDDILAQWVRAQMTASTPSRASPRAASTPRTSPEATVACTGWQ